jgi:hypothetical protein
MQFLSIHYFCRQSTLLFPKYGMALIAHSFVAPKTGVATASCTENISQEKNLTELPKIAWHFLWEV